MAIGRHVIVTAYSLSVNYFAALPRPDFSSVSVGKALLVQESTCALAPLRYLPHPTSRSTDPLIGRRALLCGCRPVSDEREVLIQKAIAVVTDNDVVGEEDDFRRRMRTGLLFFRWQR